MRRSDFMDSSSTPSHWNSTTIRHKLAIELLLDDENSEKAIILDKVQNHAKIREEKYRIQSRVDFFLYIIFCIVVHLNGYDM